MNLLTLNYWFSSTEPFLSWVAATLFILLSFFLVAGIFARVWSKKQTDRFVRQVFVRISRLLVTLSLVAFVCFFFTQQAIPLLGARFWYLVLAIVGGAWIFFIIRHYKKVVPLLRQKAAERAQFEKYLPKNVRG